MPIRPLRYFPAALPKPTPLRNPRACQSSRSDMTFATLMSYKLFLFAIPRLERDDFSLNCHPALAYCLSMIFSENRYPLFGIMLQMDMLALRIGRGSPSHVAYCSGS